MQIKYVKYNGKAWELLDQIDAKTYKLGLCADWLRTVAAPIAQCKNISEAAAGAMYLKSTNTTLDY